MNLREIRRTYDRTRKLPRTLVEELARTTALAHDVWVEAREKSDFGLFRPWLEKIVALKRQEAILNRGIYFCIPAHMSSGSINSMNCRDDIFKGSACKVS